MRIRSASDATDRARVRRWIGAVVAPIAVGAVAAVATFGVLDGSSDGPRAGAGSVAARDAESATVATPGRSVFARMGCGGCHRLAAAGSEGAGAPNLDVALAGYTRASLKAKIPDPYRYAPPDSFTVMPRDYGRRLSRAELDALVTFLLDARDVRCRTEPSSESRCRS